MSLGLDGMFQPGLRHWREYIDMERMRINVKPALGPGPKGGPVEVNLTTGDVIIDVSRVQAEEATRESRREGLS
ncbi:MAG: hypothetical protein FWF36_00640 [Propionibacteriaceae bacterium]|nr:hypothetical protein [Propionibacteriaceae bacterium]